jgi:tRNA threonylcarbamoyladenosine biosynthesis protein TsaB
MIILCIESTAFHSSVALFEGETLIINKDSAVPNSHSEILAQMIADILTQGQLKPIDLDAIAVSSGPGSYTSLRVGASLAKGMCFALDIPLIALDSLLITAFPYFSIEESSDFMVIPTIDARRDEAYISIYGHTGEQLEAAHPHIFDQNSFVHLNREKILICGNAAKKAGDLIQDSRIKIEDSHPRAIYMGSLAYEQFKAKSFADVAYFEPNYIKLPNITTPKKPLI